MPRDKKIPAAKETSRHLTALRQEGTQPGGNCFFLLQKALRCVFFNLVVNILGGNTGTSSSVLALGVWV